MNLHSETKTFCTVFPHLQRYTFNNTLIPCFLPQQHVLTSSNSNSVGLPLKATPVSFLFKFLSCFCFVLRGQNAEIQKGRILFYTNVIFGLQQESQSEKEKRAFQVIVFFSLICFCFALFGFCKIFSEAIYLCKKLSILFMLFM